jgi:hypothetical protein
MDYRVILYHKQPTSARTRFLRYGYDSVCASEPLPPLSQLVEGNGDGTALHPTAVLQGLEEKMGLAAGSLKADAEFQQKVEVPDGSIPIILAAFTSMDPPFEAVEQAGAAFIDLTQARDLPAIELELLRKAYEVILGG